MPEPIKRAIQPCVICGAHYMCQSCFSKMQLQRQAEKDQPLIPPSYDGTVVDPTPDPESPPAPVADIPPEDTQPSQTSTQTPPEVTPDTP